jgi:photosystem II stability/assembly factor-like uncharacterized protein
VDFQSNASRVIRIRVLASDLAQGGLRSALRAAGLIGNWLFRIWRVVNESFGTASMRELVLRYGRRALFFGCALTLAWTGLGSGNPAPAKQQTAIWRIDSGLSAHADVLGVSCTPTGTCLSIVRVGSLLEMVELGRVGISSTWNISTRLAPTSMFSCATREDCMGLEAVDSVAGRTIVLDTSSGGRTWRRVGIASGFEPTSVLCVLSDRCLALGIRVTKGAVRQAVFRTADEGRVWHASTVPDDAPPVGGITCSTGGQCYAYTFFESPNGLLFSADFGHTWKEIGGTVATRNDDLVDVTCGRASTCVGLLAARGSRKSSEALWIRNGTLLHSESDPIDSNWIWGSCPTDEVCVVGGFVSASSTRVLQTTSAGGSWTEENEPPSVEVATVVCPSRDWCVGIGVSRHRNYLLRITLLS